MDSFLDADITGLEDAERVLTEQAPLEAAKMLKRLDMRAANVLKDAAQAQAPVDTGRLEESMTRQTVYGPASFKSFGDAPVDVQQGEVCIRVGPTKSGFYGFFDEYGTQHQQGTHWLLHAAESARQECVSVFTEEAKKMVDNMEKGKP